MRQLLNTLFVTSEDIYLSLDGENSEPRRGSGRALSAAHAAKHRHLLLRRGFACIDGKMRAAGDRACVLLATGKIPCARFRADAGKCSSAADAVPRRR